MLCNYMNYMVYYMNYMFHYMLLSPIIWNPTHLA
jgi:hypothetical protein